MSMTQSVEAVSTEPRQPNQEELKPLYMEALTLVERLHRRLLDVIKDEFDRAGRSDVNAVQALLLFNIGDAELTAGELRTRGYYLGSNVSYNLKKLVEMGYIHHQRSRMDRRSVRVSLTDKGRKTALEHQPVYFKDYEDVLFAGFTAAEAAAFRRQLTQMILNLDAADADALPGTDAARRPAASA